MEPIFYPYEDPGMDEIKRLRLISMMKIFDPFVDMNTIVAQLHGNRYLQWEVVRKCIEDMYSTVHTNSGRILLAIVRQVPIDATLGFHIYWEVMGLKPEITDELQNMNSTRGGLYALCYHIWEYLEDRMSTEELRSRVRDVISDISDEIAKSIEIHQKPTILSDINFILQHLPYSRYRCRKRIHPPRGSVVRQIVPYYILEKCIEIGAKSLDSVFFTDMAVTTEASLEIVSLLIRWCNSLTPDDCTRVLNLMRSITLGSKDRPLFVREIVEHYIPRGPLPTTLPLQYFINNAQNIHCVRIESDVLVEFDTLDAMYKGREDSFEMLHKNPALREALERIDEDTSDFHGRTLKEWFRIVFLWSKDEGHLPILEQELKDMVGMCPSGHFRRLINVMNGFLFHLEDSVHDYSPQRPFFNKVDALIQAQPDCDEIVCDIATRGVKYVNDVAVEYMLHRDQWSDVLEYRRIYLYGE